MIRAEAVPRFLSLSGSGQMLVCAFWRWKDDVPAILSRDQLFAIMGWKKAARQDAVQEQVKRLGTILDRLVKDGFLASWKILPNGAYWLDKVCSSSELEQAKRQL